MTDAVPWQAAVVSRDQHVSQCHLGARYDHSAIDFISITDSNEDP